jgi:hypothetical protein
MTMDTTETTDTAVTRDRDRIRVEQHSMGGLLWLGGWLYTIGFLQLTFGKGVLALLLWPYYLGVAFAPLLRTGTGS